MSNHSYDEVFFVTFETDSGEVDKMWLIAFERVGGS
jgi:hypothetical protein